MWPGSDPWTFDHDGLTYIATFGPSVNYYAKSLFRRTLMTPLDFIRNTYVVFKAICLPHTSTLTNQLIS